MENLGQRWEILNLYFKPYAACRWAQPAVAGALKITREHHLTPDQIRRIRVRTFEAATRLPNGHPRNTEEAQYSLAFPVAAALLDGEVGPIQVLPPRLHDPDLLAYWIGSPPKSPLNLKPSSRPKPRPKWWSRPQRVRYTDPAESKPCGNRRIRCPRTAIWKQNFSG